MDLKEEMRYTNTDKDLTELKDQIDKDLKQGAISIFDANRAWMMAVASRLQKDFCNMVGLQYIGFKKGDMKKVIKELSGGRITL